MWSSPKCQLEINEITLAQTVAFRGYQFIERLVSSVSGIATCLDTRRRPTVPLCPTIAHHCIIPSARTNSMSHSNFTDSMSSNFQLIINDALKAYEQHTKKDLLAHPLASQLQACDSPTAILNVLQQQIQGADQSRNSNDRWTKWLDLTVNILYALCDTLGEGVGLVSPKT